MATMRVIMEVVREMTLVMDVARVVTSKEIVRNEVQALVGVGPVEEEPAGENIMTGNRGIPQTIANIIVRFIKGKKESIVHLILVYR